MVTAWTNARYVPVSRDIVLTPFHPQQLYWLVEHKKANYVLVSQDDFLFPEAQQLASQGLLRPVSYVNDYILYQRVNP